MCFLKFLVILKAFPQTLHLLQDNHDEETLSWIKSESGKLIFSYKEDLFPRLKGCEIMSFFDWEKFSIEYKRIYKLSWRNEILLV